MKYGFRITLLSQEAAQLYYSKGGFSIQGSRRNQFTSGVRNRPVAENAPERGSMDSTELASVTLTQQTSASDRLLKA
jgi:hypothetical protein